MRYEHCHHRYLEHSSNGEILGLSCNILLQLIVFCSIEEANIVEYSGRHAPTVEIRILGSNVTPPMCTISNARYRPRTLEKRRPYRKLGQAHAQLKHLGGADSSQGRSLQLYVKMQIGLQVLLR